MSVGVHYFGYVFEDEVILEAIEKREKEKN